MGSVKVGQRHLKNASVLRNFEENLFRKTSVNGCLEKSTPNFPKEGFLSKLLIS